MPPNRVTVLLGVQHDRVPGSAQHVPAHRTSQLRQRQLRGVSEQVASHISNVPFNYGRINTSSWGCVILATNLRPANQLIPFSRPHSSLLSINLSQLRGDLQQSVTNSFWISQIQHPKQVSKFTIQILDELIIYLR